MALFCKSTIWKLSDELPSPPRACEGEEGKRSNFGGWKGTRHPSTAQHLSHRTVLTAALWLFPGELWWDMFVLHRHQLSTFRKIGRAENYQHLSNLVCPPTAKHCVFIWNGGSLTAAENSQVFPVSFRYIIVICQTKVRKFKCFEFIISLELIISHVHTDM